MTFRKNVLLISLKNYLENKVAMLKILLKKILYNILKVNSFNKYNETIYISHPE